MIITIQMMKSNNTLRMPLRSLELSKLLCITLSLFLFLSFIPLSTQMKMITHFLKTTSNKVFKTILNRGLIHLRPISYETPNISLIIWGGYGVSPHHYTGFSEYIQQYGKLRNLNVEVFIPEYQTIPCDTNSKNIFLFGHSSGGYDALQLKREDIHAVITYGATHNSKGKLYMGIGKIPKIHNKNTLTMIGEKDGYISYINILDEFSKTNTTHNSLIVRGTNHLCVSNNETNSICKMIGLKDQFSKIDRKNASKRIASVIVDYILYIMKKDQFFLKYIENTRGYLKFVETFIRLDRFVLPVMIKETVDHHICIMDRFQSFWKFILSKPTYSRGKVYSDISTIWVKCFKKTSYPQMNKQISRVNRMYNSFLQKQNISIDHVKYHRCATTLEWIIRKPEINYTDNSNTLVLQYFLYKNYMYIKAPSILSICEKYIV
mgnify:CR=1 FL=1